MCVSITQTLIYTGGQGCSQSVHHIDLRPERQSKAFIWFLLVLFLKKKTIQYTATTKGFRWNSLILRDCRILSERQQNLFWHNGGHWMWQHWLWTESSFATSSYWSEWRLRLWKVLIVTRHFVGRGTKRVFLSQATRSAAFFMCLLLKTATSKSQIKQSC